MATFCLEKFCHFHIKRENVRTPFEWNFDDSCPIQLNGLTTGYLVVLKLDIILHCNHLKSLIVPRGKK